MTAAPISKPKTVEDLIALETETGMSYEIVNGEFVGATVSDKSSETNSAFNYFLYGHVVPRGLGRVYDADMIYDLPKSTRKADVSVLLRTRIPSSEVTHFTGAPDLVVEVQSPSDRGTAVRAKIQEWLDAGARLVWRAEPESGEVTVYRRGRRPVVLVEGDILDGEDVLPGFAVDVSDLFPSRMASRQEMSPDR